MTRLLLALFAFFTLVISGPARSAEIRVAVTTSFYNSGLSDILLPAIKTDLDLDVHLIVVGTGQALKLGRSGDVDAVLVHSRKAEDDFVAQGYGASRREIMYNDFVLIGPRGDPANVAASQSATEALKRIEKTQSTFISRGDDSGTHRRELALWTAAGANAETFSSSWYRAVGSGMGAALNIASGMNGYILSDRASWLNFGNKGDLTLLFSGDPALFNQYAYLPVNPERHAHVKFELAKVLENWLAGSTGQSMIASYEIDGNTLFTPNARSQ